MWVAWPVVPNTYPLKTTLQGKVSVGRNLAGYYDKREKIEEYQVQKRVFS